MRRTLWLMLGGMLPPPVIGGAQQAPVCPEPERSRSVVVLASTAERPGALHIRAVSINGGAPLPMAEVRVVGVGGWQSAVDSAVIGLQELAGRKLEVEVRALGYGIARTTTRVAPDSGLVGLAVMVPIVIHFDEHCRSERAPEEAPGSRGLEPRLVLRDGPEARADYWDSAAIVLNEKTVYCPTRGAQDSVARISPRTLRALQPERIDHIEVRRTAPPWLAQLCGGQVARVLEMRYRGKPPRGGKERR